jgi:hypothetical protein
VNLEPARSTADGLQADLDAVRAYMVSSQCEAVVVALLRTGAHGGRVEPQEVINETFVRVCAAVINRRGPFDFFCVEAFVNRALHTTYWDMMRRLLRTVPASGLGDDPIAGSALLRQSSEDFVTRSTLKQPQADRETSAGAARGGVGHRRAHLAFAGQGFPAPESTAVARDLGERLARRITQRLSGGDIRCAEHERPGQHGGQCPSPSLVAAVALYCVHEALGLIDPEPVNWEPGASTRGLDRTIYEALARLRPDEFASPPSDDRARAARRQRKHRLARCVRALLQQVAGELDLFSS